MVCYTLSEHRLHVLDETVQSAVQNPSYMSAICLFAPEINKMSDQPRPGTTPYVAKIFVGIFESPPPVLPPGAIFPSTENPDEIRRVLP